MVVAPPAASKTALVMGVANSHSIAWACVKSLMREHFNVICTFQNERFRTAVENMISEAKLQAPGLRLVALACNVESEIPTFFQDRIGEFLPEGKLDAIVHSVAYASPESMKHGSLLDTSKEDYIRAHHISAYSFLETARYAKPLLNKSSSSLTTISYLGACRAIPNYNIMGPAKASLEGIVRGLALELGKSTNGVVRVNAVSSGPLNTLAARGITGFSDMRQEAAQRSPLLRNVYNGELAKKCRSFVSHDNCKLIFKALSAILLWKKNLAIILYRKDEVADTVTFLATRGTGITGQTIYVDGGYSVVGGP
jgi:enoyl-[acyl-carrier protein] reductase I